MHALDTITLLNLEQEERARRAATPTPDLIEEHYRRRTETRTGGASTPSTAASPPHDAEAAREEERLKAAAEYLKIVRAWAAGEGPTIPDPAAELRARVEKVLDDLSHIARQHGGTADAFDVDEYPRTYYAARSTQLGILEAIEHIKGALQ